MTQRDIETRLSEIEGILGGTMDTPGLIHIQRQIVETIYGKKGTNGLLADVQGLKLDRARVIAWIAGAAFSGSLISGVFTWLLSHIR